MEEGGVSLSYHVQVFFREMHCSSLGMDTQKLTMPSAELAPTCGSGSVMVLECQGVKALRIT